MDPVPVCHVGSVLSRGRHVGAVLHWVVVLLELFLHARVGALRLLHAVWQGAASAALHFDHDKCDDDRDEHAGKEEADGNANHATGGHARRALQRNRGTKQMNAQCIALQVSIFALDCFAVFTPHKKQKRAQNPHNAHLLHDHGGRAWRLKARKHRKGREGMSMQE